MSESNHIDKYKELEKQCTKLENELKEKLQNYFDEKIEI